MKVLVLGDKPSRLNTNPNVAFVGSKSYKILLEWLDYVLPQQSIYRLHNRVDKNLDLFDFNVRIALGNEASKFLEKHNLKHFKLPHPSPRNRQLNDKAFIKQKLDECKTFLAK